MEHSSPLSASPLGSGEEPPGDELALAQKAAAGDADALSQLYERHKDAIYGVCYRVLRDAAEAADLLHDTFLLLLEGRRGTPPKTSVRGWLVRVASNLAIDRLRQRKVRSSSAADPAARHERLESGAGPVAAAEHAELSRSVQDAIAELSPRLRIAVTLRYAAGLSYEEIAEALECSIGTVKSRLARAHARLAGPLARLRGAAGSDIAPE